MDLSPLDPSPIQPSAIGPLITLAPLFTYTGYRHILEQILTCAELSAFGAIGKLNKYCRDVVRARTPQKQLGCIVPAPSGDPSGKWVNWRFKHNDLPFGDFKLWSIHPLGWNKSYFDRPRLVMECQYKNGRRHGLYRRYAWPTTDSDALIVAAMVQPDLSIEARPNEEPGGLTEEIHYENGIIHGRYRRFYSNKKIFIECEFVHGKLHGEYISMDDQGRILIRRYYHYGIPHGRCEEWINSYTKVRDDVYHYGTLVERIPFENPVYAKSAEPSPAPMQM